MPAPVSRPQQIVIVGGGASGTLAAIHLARTAEGRALQLTVVEPGRLGEGIAYSTRDPKHRLNVPAAGMSAYPDDPEHFLRWVRGRGAADFPAGGFALRRDYGKYLVQTLSEALDEAPSVDFEHVRTRAENLVPNGAGWRVDLAGGVFATADAIVLALGSGVPAVAWAPAGLLQSPRFVADPWAVKVTDEDVPGRDGTVLIVGAGLSMADLAMSWERNGATVHVVSRHGLLPLAHTADPKPKPPTPDLPEAADLAALRRFVFEQIRAGDDWRGGVDSLRPITQALWAMLPIEDQMRFLRTDNRRWGRIRHRVAPEVGAWLDEALADGRLINHEGTVTDAHDTAGRIEVRLTSGGAPSNAGVAAGGGTKIHADVVVNCTGPANDPAHGTEPLLHALLDSGVVRAHPVGIGLDVDADGVPRSNVALPPIVTLGPPRQGELWESTAIPEIRVQAAALPDQLLRD